jgi:hypothetical protein
MDEIKSLFNGFLADLRSSIETQNSIIMSNNAKIDELKGQINNLENENDIANGVLEETRDLLLGMSDDLVDLADEIVVDGDDEIDFDVDSADFDDEDDEDDTDTEEDDDDNTDEE